LLLLTEATLNAVNLPWAVFVQPRRLGSSRTLPDASRVARCQKCFGYICNHSKVTSRWWVCSLCGENNNLPPRYQVPKKGEIPELKHGSIDLVVEEVPNSTQNIDRDHRNSLAGGKGEEQKADREPAMVRPVRSTKPCRERLAVIVDVATSSQFIANAQALLLSLTSQLDEHVEVCLLATSDVVMAYDLTSPHLPHTRSAVTTPDASDADSDTGVGQSAARRRRRQQPAVESEVILSDLFPPSMRYVPVAAKETVAHDAWCKAIRALRPRAGRATPDGTPIKAVSEAIRLLWWEQQQQRDNCPSHKTSLRILCLSSAGSLDGDASPGGRSVDPASRLPLILCGDAASNPSPATTATTATPLELLQGLSAWGWSAAMETYALCLSAYPLGQEALWSNCIHDATRTDVLWDVRLRIRCSPAWEVVPFRAVESVLTAGEEANESSDIYSIPALFSTSSLPWRAQFTRGAGAAGFGGQSASLSAPICLQVALRYSSPTLQGDQRQLIRLYSAAFRHSHKVPDIWASLSDEGLSRALQLWNVPRQPADIPPWYPWLHSLLLSAAEYSPLVSKGLREESVTMQLKHGTPFLSGPSLLCRGWPVLGLPLGICYLQARLLAWPPLWYARGWQWSSPLIPCPRLSLRGEGVGGSNGGGGEENTSRQQSEGLPIYAMDMDGRRQGIEGNIAAIEQQLRRGQAVIVDTGSMLEVLLPVAGKEKEEEGKDAEQGGDEAVGRLIAACQAFTTSVVSAREGETACRQWHVPIPPASAQGVQGPLALPWGVLPFLSDPLAWQSELPLCRQALKGWSEWLDGLQQVD
jgi:hypothetical protein